MSAVFQDRTAFVITMNMPEGQPGGSELAAWDLGDAAEVRGATAFDAVVLATLSYVQLDTAGLLAGTLHI